MAAHNHLSSVSGDPISSSSFLGHMVHKHTGRKNTHNCNEINLQKEKRRILLQLFHGLPIFPVSPFLLSTHLIISSYYAERRNRSEICVCLPRLPLTNVRQGPSVGLACPRAGILVLVLRATYKIWRHILKKKGGC